MQTTSTDNFERVVSSPRLNSYKNYFKAKTMDEVIELYLWNGEISSCFASHLAYFEVALRNSVHRAMSLFYSRGQFTSCSWYDFIWTKLRLSTRQRIIEVRQRRGRESLSPDEVVASVSLGFWPVVLRNIESAHAPSIFSAIFPHHPLSATPADWRDAEVRRHAIRFVFELHAFRNRLAHHEPLWKFSPVKNTTAHPPIYVEHGSKSQSDSINRLRQLLTQLEEATGYIDRTLEADLRSASWRRKLDFLLTERGIQRYRALRHNPRSAALTPSEFRHRFTLIGRQGQPVRVQRSHASGIFVPD